MRTLNRSCFANLSYVYRFTLFPYLNYDELESSVQNGRLWRLWIPVESKSWWARKIAGPWMVCYLVVNRLQFYFSKIWRKRMKCGVLVEVPRVYGSLPGGLRVREIHERTDSAALLIAPWMTLSWNTQNCFSPVEVGSVCGSSWRIVVARGPWEYWLGFTLILGPVEFLITTLFCNLRVSMCYWNFATACRINVPRNS